MKKLKTYKSKNKLLLITITCILIVVFSVGIPTLARYKNRNIVISTVWNGEVATSYRSGSGTSLDPYIISDGSELAFFASNLNTTNYENTYFRLNSDIIINSGIFDYDNNLIKYTIDNNTYYINPYTDDYYEDSSYTLLKGSINIFSSLDNFKGNFDGNSYRIYGLYISDSSSEELALFTNLNGNISNLYVENALIYGGDISSGIASSANNSNITNVLYNGFVISGGSELDLAAGIVGNATNVNLTNVINKGKIIANNMASGLLGEVDDAIINNSYNTGEVVSINYGSGLIGNVFGEIEINNSYNSGIINSNNKSAFISQVDSTSTVTISNTFDAASVDNLIDSSNNNVLFDNCYYTYTSLLDSPITGLNIVTLDQLSDEEFLTDNLLFNEFISYEDYNINNSNIWVFNNSLPKLFIDDSELSVTVNVQNYSWNNFTTDLIDIYISSSIVFSINTVGDYNDVESIKYYISNDILSKSTLESIEWLDYDGIEEITTEGEYIIYAKVVDNSNNIYYLNSDNLVLDKTESSVSISMDSNIWNAYSSELDSIYIDMAKNINISATDEMSGISKIEYYISNEVILENDLDDVDWELYENNLSISNSGANVLYVKVTDKCNNITYANTDYIILDGYQLNDINVGNTSLSDNINITDKSTIEFNYVFNGNNNYNNVSHNIVSNTLLPLGTKLIIKDNLLHKYYKYIIDDEDEDYGYLENGVATYSFSLFNEIGTNSNVLFSDASLEDEDYTLILDLSGTNLDEDYLNVLLYIELKNQDGKVLIPTLNSNKKYFNIYINKIPEITLSTDTVIGSINYNSNSSTEVNLNSNIVYEKNSDLSIYDSNYMTKDMYLKINLYNSSNVQISKNYLKNIILEYNNVKYYAYNDGSYYINLESSNDGILKIITNEDISKLTNGNYTLKIKNYVSTNGIYNSLYAGEEIVVPVTVMNSNKDYSYEYTVDISSSNRIINKDNNGNLTFDIHYDGDLDNPSVIVSMYSKDLITAYNQDYSIVDMNEYINNNLVKFSDNYYYAIENVNNIDNTFLINLNCSKLDYNGYKFVFDLYDGNKKVDTISKNVVVK